MPARDLPPGWSYNPSRFAERLPVLLIALLACGIATYLTLYQVHVLSSVWEPFFGNGSTRILRESAIARFMARYTSIPDASLGAFGYLVEVLTDGFGGDDRWRRRPWVVLLLGLTAAGLAFAGVILVISQWVFFGAYCTLCMVVATCSVLMVGFVMDEVLATLQYLKRTSNLGHSVWRTLWGLEEPTTAEQTGGEPRAEGRQGNGMSAQFGCFLLGVWLMAAPAVLGYGERAAISARTVGPIAAAVGLAAMHEVLRPLRRINYVIGFWLLLAPWVLGYGTAALSNSLGVGVVLLVLASFRGSLGQHTGGGWSVLWKGQPTT